MSNLLNNGIIEVATLTPMSIQIADPKYNVDRMLELIHEVNEKNRIGERQTRIVVYPELSVTAYNCGELFNQSALLDNANKELKRFVDESNDEFNPIMIVGMPIRKDNQLFNCAVVIHRGKILGVIPKTFLPNYTVLYEARYFSSSVTRIDDEIVMYGDKIPFTPNLLFEDEQTGAIVSAELCEDLWMNLPPSAYHCLHGANIVANLSSSNQTFGKTAYREDLLKVHSSICSCGYIYTCATAAETTIDSVFAGHNMIVENGDIVSETRFMENKDITYGEIDIEKSMNERALRGSYMTIPDRQEYKHIYFKTFEPKSKKFKSNRELPLLPFVPQDIENAAKDTFNLQVSGLAERLKKNQCDKIVIDMCSGLNSILGLIAAVEAFKLNNYDVKGITGVIIPCSDTENKIVDETKKLMELLNVNCVHLDEERKKAQVLMDVADKYKAVVIGIADLTEIAVGENSYHVDQISVYGVNAAVPKTVIRSIVYYYAKKQEVEIGTVLLDICDKYFNFELLLENPYEKVDNIEFVDSYIVYDFILHNMLKCGFGPKKIYDLYVNSRMLNAKNNGINEDVVDKKKVLKDMKFFYKNFFGQQFKRSSVPDTIKIYGASLVQNDWRMPSDASAEVWLRELSEIVE
ncbi:NAD(+) synthase [Clostridium sp. P21]|uniref:Glutamine-dependent NAD(+) synthetase n=1 Tax=Clostridium muellerianum TaxID=2716538 RepID=A0A7Y0EFC1_9CLOT|nr:nitrilase-related carbon-nitrogen hydrolase [Clostridium muellerianum]NMM62420.1 NAD(+) synthase [Clostridium muellerianum]